MTPFQVFLFVSVWPPMWNGTRDDFTIHGVWPEYSNGTWPEYCCDTPDCEFDISIIEPIRYKLYTNWNDYNNPPEFWKHEWDRHGTCSGLSELDYFKYGLYLHSSIDILEYLQMNDITPGYTYSKKDIENAFTVKPLLQCKGNQLEQVGFCVEGTNIVTCPSGIYSKWSSKCPSRIEWMKYKSTWDFTPYIMFFYQYIIGVFFILKCCCYRD